jgi:hypothetical protein
MTKLVVERFEEVREGIRLLDDDDVEFSGAVEWERSLGGVRVDKGVSTGKRNRSDDMISLPASPNMAQ